MRLYIFLIAIFFVFYSSLANSQEVRNNWPMLGPNPTFPYFHINNTPIPIGGFANAVAVNPTDFAVPIAGEQTLKQPFYIQNLDRNIFVDGVFRWSNNQLYPAISKFINYRYLGADLALTDDLFYVLSQKNLEWELGADNLFYTSLVSQEREVYDSDTDESILYFTTTAWGTNFHTTSASQLCIDIALLTRSQPRYPDTIYYYHEIDLDVTRPLKCFGREIDTRPLPGPDDPPLSPLPVFQYASAFANNVEDISCPQGYERESGDCVRYVSTDPVLATSAELQQAFGDMTFNNVSPGGFYELINYNVIDYPRSFEITNIDPNPILSEIKIEEIFNELTNETERTETQTTVEFDYGQKDSNNNTVLDSTVKTNEKKSVNGTVAGNQTTSQNGSYSGNPSDRYTPGGSPISGSGTGSGGGVGDGIGSSGGGGSGSTGDEFDWLCGIDGTEDCKVSVNDSGFENANPLGDHQAEYDGFLGDISSHIDGILFDLENTTINQDTLIDNEFGFSMDALAFDFGFLQRECNNPQIKLMNDTYINVDLCTLSNYVRPVMSFLLYMFFMYRLREMFFGLLRGDNK